MEGSQKMKRVKFLGQLFYFNCTIPDAMDGCEIGKINYDFRGTTITDPEADVWFIFRPEIMPVELLRQLRGRKVWVSTEPLERRDGENVLPLYSRFAKIHRMDLVVHYDRQHLHTLAKMGIRAQEFQLPVNTNLYKPLHLPRDRDIFFGGRSTAHREEMLGRLKRDYAVEHVAHNTTRATGDSDRQFCQSCNRAEICLNIHIEPSFRQLQHRVQNMLSTGAFVITEPLSHHYDIIPGTHVEVAMNRDELEEKVRFYLSHPDKTQPFREKGMEVVKEKFDAEKQWMKLLNQIT